MVRITNAGIVLAFRFVKFNFPFHMFYYRPVVVVLVRAPTPSFIVCPPQRLEELSFLFENYSHPAANPVGAPSFVGRIPKALGLAPISVS